MYEEWLSVKKVILCLLGNNISSSRQKILCLLNICPKYLIWDLVLYIWSVFYPLLLSFLSNIFYVTLWSNFNSGLFLIRFSRGIKFYRIRESIELRSVEIESFSVGTENLDRFREVIELWGVEIERVDRIFLITTFYV